MMQMSIKTLELEKASPQALRGTPTRSEARRRAQVRPDPYPARSNLFFFFAGHEPRPRRRLRVAVRAARAELALEHKALAWTSARRSLVRGRRHAQARKLTALNPRHRVPVLVDGDFVLYESNAIVEYLDEAYPAAGARRCFPATMRRTRALARRLILEADNDSDKAVDPDDRRGVRRRSPRSASAARNWPPVAARTTEEDLALFDRRRCSGDFLAGPLSACRLRVAPAGRVPRRGAR